MANKVCPFKFNINTLDKDGEHKTYSCLCEGQVCALWEEVTGTCALKTQAYLVGREVAFLER